MLIPIWLGMGLSSLGLALLVVFGLVRPNPGSAVHDWGFRVGVALLLAGFALTVVAA